MKLWGKKAVYGSLSAPQSVGVNIGGYWKRGAGQLSSLSNAQNWDLRLNWRHFAFFLGVPVAIASYESIGDRYWIETLGIPTSVAFHMGHAIIPWWISAICTKGAMELLRRWKPNLLVLALCGALLANVVTAPYVHWVSTQFLSEQELAPSEGLQFFRESAQAGLLWMMVTFLFDRFLGFRIFRYDGQTITDVRFFEQPELADPTDAVETVRLLPEPRFLERVRPLIKVNDVTVLKAEEHYIRIFVQDREELVLYRFSDAVAEMGPSLGCQVHRSYWVAFDAIERVETEERKLTLYLKSGQAVPVSARYQEIVRQRTKDLKLPAGTATDS